MRMVGRTAAADVADDDLELLCKSCHGKATRAEAMHGGVGSDREQIQKPPRRPDLWRVNNVKVLVQKGFRRAK